MIKQWKLLPKINKEIVSQFPDINPVSLQLLFNRKIDTQEKIDEFFNSDYLDDIHDPFLLLDMKKAVQRIYQAVEKDEKVLVYGDYDADGVTSSALLYDILGKIGLKVKVYIPHRETEGYGFNMDSVQEIIDKKYSLVISCDCGISNFTEIEKLKNNNIDVIITDHHKEPEKLPPAIAIIHAGLKREKKYPFAKLAGVGIAYKLACGILKSDLCQFDKKEQDKIAKWLLDLVAIGTVADMVPLIGENRTLTKYGLIVLKKTPRLGLRELYKISAINIEKINSYTIGFQIGPRLNAAGRIDHANTAFELLITKDSKRATEISKELSLKNKERQEITKQLVLEAKKDMESLDYQKSIWVQNKNWNLGIIGLVAGKLANEYYRPSFVLGYYDHTWVCSSRGIEEIDLMDVINNVSNKLIRFGGHKSAAGFSVSADNVQEVRNSIQKYINQKLSNMELSPSIYLDAEIGLEDINWDLWKDLDRFEPFGVQNKKPKFLIRDCRITEIQFLGADQSHLKIGIEKKALFKKAIGFRMVKTFSKLRINDIVDLIVEIGLNEWNGNRSLELYISDLKIKDNK